jgi:hypothetical protein
MAGSPLYKVEEQMPRQDQSRAKSAELRLMNMNQKYNHLTPYRQDSGNASVLDKNLN